MNSKVIPPLRSQILLIEQPGNPEYPVVLVDDELEQQMKLDRQGATICSLLDRPQTLDQLYERLEAAAPGLVSYDELQDVVSALSSYHLLSTEDAELHVASLTAGEKPLEEEELLFLDDDYRFNCVMCGSCCGGQNIGPVETPVLERLSPHREELLQLTGSKKGLFYTMELQGKGTQVVTRMENDYCVFVDEKNLCILHREYGPDHKPLLCNIFPLHFVRTPKGIAVSFQMECRSYLKSKRAAKEPLSANADYIRSLLAQKPMVPQMRPIVPLDGRHSLTFEEYEELEQRALQTIDQHNKDIRGAVVAVGKMLDEARQLPPVDGPADLDQLRSQLYGLRDALLEELHKLKGVHARSNEQVYMHTRGLDHLVETLGLWEQLWERSMRRSIHRDVAEVWDDTYRYYFFSKDITGYNSMIHGQALFGLRLLLTELMATKLARLVKRRFVSPQDLFDAQVIMATVFRNTLIKKVFTRHAKEIEELFHRRLGQLISDYKDLVQQSERFEFYVF